MKTVNWTSKLKNGNIFYAMWITNFSRKTIWWHGPPIIPDGNHQLWLRSWWWGTMCPSLLPAPLREPGLIFYMRPWLACMTLGKFFYSFSLGSPICKMETLIIKLSPEVSFEDERTSTTSFSTVLGIQKALRASCCCPHQSALQINSHLIVIQT